MRKIQIPLPTPDNETFIEDFIKFINTFLGTGNKLTKGESRVLSLIMQMDNPERTPLDREIMLLDFKTVKETIMFDMNISKARLGNLISSLRKKGALRSTPNGYTLNPVYDNAVYDQFPFKLEIVWVKEETEEI